MSEMSDSNDVSVGEIVRDDIRTAKVFQSYGIDFCCGGSKSLEEACEEQNVAVSEVQKSLSEVKSSSAGPDVAHYDGWPLDLLVDYIEKKHHRYVESNLTVITEGLDKLCSVHGEQAPELFKIRDAFSISAGNLAQHMKKEELILFPYIRNLVDAKNGSGEVRKGPIDSARSPIDMMESEHDQEGANFKRIEALSNGYAIPEWGCTTYKYIFKLLKEFQDDLHMHVHLENNILFPRTLALEATMNQ